MKRSFFKQKFLEHHPSLLHQARLDVYLSSSFLTNRDNLQELNHAKKGRPFQFSDPLMSFLIFLKHSMNLPYRKTIELSKIIFASFESSIVLPSYVQLSRRSQLVKLDLPKKNLEDLERLEVLLSSTRFKLGDPLLSNQVFKKFPEWEKIQLIFDMDQKVILKKRIVKSQDQMDSGFSLHLVQKMSKKVTGFQKVLGSEKLYKDRGLSRKEKKRGESKNFE
jgi:hypothetical protein